MLLEMISFEKIFETVNSPGKQCSCPVVTRTSGGFLLKTFSRYVSQGGFLKKNNETLSSFHQFLLVIATRGTT